MPTVPHRTDGITGKRPLTIGTVAGILSLSGSPVPQILTERFQALGLDLLSISDEHCWFGSRAGTGRPTARLSVSARGPVKAVCRGWLDAAGGRTPGEHFDQRDGANPAAALEDVYHPAQVENLLDLNGDYLFAIWDARTRQLWSGVDRLGSYALYHWHNEDLWFWADEPETVLRLAGRDVRPDLDRIGQFLGRCDDWKTACSFLRGIDQSLPGQILGISPDGQRVLGPREWVREADLRATNALEDCGPGLRSALEESIARRLGTGGRTSILFSGGIDSTVLAIAAKDRTPPEHRITAACGAYSLPEEKSALSSAADLSRRLGLEPCSLAESPPGFVGSARSYQAVAPEPFLPLNAPMMLALLQSVSNEGSGVALTGFGADQLFAMSLQAFFLDAITEGRLGRCGTYLRMARASRWKTPALSLVHALLERFAQVFRPGMAANGVQPVLDRGVRVSATAQLAAKVLVHPLHHRWMSWWRTLADVSGVSIRHPFLDLDVIRFVLSVPATQRVGPAYGKKLLRDGFVRNCGMLRGYRKVSEWPLVDGAFSIDVVTGCLGPIRDWRLADAGLVTPQDEAGWRKGRLTDDLSIVDAVAAEQWLRARFS